MPAGASVSPAAEESEGPPTPRLLQPQTVRLVVAGLTMVTLAGLIIDLRGRPAELAVEAFVLAFVVAIVVLTSRWWEPSGKPTPKPRVRVFVALAGVAVLAQLLGLAVDPADVSVNLVPLLLVGVLFLNSFG